MTTFNFSSFGDLKYFILNQTMPKPKESVLSWNKITLDCRESQNLEEKQVLFQSLWFCNAIIFPLKLSSEFSVKPYDRVTC